MPGKVSLAAAVLHITIYSGDYLTSTANDDDEIGGLASFALLLLPVAAKLGRVITRYSYLL